MTEMSGRCASPPNPFHTLRSAAPVVIPSLLSCNFAVLGEEIRQLELGGARGLHLDIMDGHFVPNITYGLPIAKAVRRCTKLPIDVHLMISNPGDFVEEFVASGANSISIHVEAVVDPRPVLERIRAAGAAASLALNPATPLARIEPILDACDMVLVMSVAPGFGGQAFEDVALEKLAELRELVGPDMALEIDGGVNEQTIQQCAEAGADFLVVGSAIFREQDYGARIDELTRLARTGSK